MYHPYKFNLLALSLAFVLLPSLTQAQQFRYYTQPRVIYHTPTPCCHNQGHQVLQQGTQRNVIPDCNCDCGETGSDCIETPWCRLRITGGKVESIINDSTIPEPPIVDPECDIRNEDLYQGEQAKNGEIEVPIVLVVCKKRFLFQRKEYEICGCKVEVCIPCGIRESKTKECKSVKKNKELVAKIRFEKNQAGNSTADIWVYNVPGLPAQAVLATNVEANEANSLFNTNFSY